MRRLSPEQASWSCSFLKRISSKLAERTCLGTSRLTELGRWDSMTGPPLERRNVSRSLCMVQRHAATGGTGADGAVAEDGDSGTPRPDEP
ncbi:hypothetical protein MTO96_023090 [Rhipicephalus appendiculatus]